MSDLLRDSYGPWPSDSEPAGYADPGGVTRCGTSPFAAIPSSPPPPKRVFNITIASEFVELKITIEAASLAEALEKAAAAIRR